MHSEVSLMHRGLCSTVAVVLYLLCIFPVHSVSWYSAAKFGLFIHWAPVSQWGAELSWPLVCPSLPCVVQTANSTTIIINTTAELRQHREAYAALSSTFDPQRFDPVRMATLAKAAGFRYVVFTTVHCDGFSNFNTSFRPSYSIRQTPYGRDVFAQIAVAFRAQGLRVGAYYCPSLWNNPLYWSPDPLSVQTPGCAPSYNPLNNTDTAQQWDGFLQYVHGQVTELADQYAPDLFWFDCANTVPVIDQRLEELVPLLRERNPDVVVTNREGGLYQDYVTLLDKAEMQPDAIMGVQQLRAGIPFEVCSTMDAQGQWGYSPHAQWRQARDIVQVLVRIVSKGGNYLLNIGPDANGQWAPEAVESLQNISDWMTVNAESVHETVPCWPFEYQMYTRLPIHGAQQPLPPYFSSCSANSGVMYISVPTQDDIVPDPVEIPWLRPAMLKIQQRTIDKVEILGVPNCAVSWKLTSAALQVFADPAATGVAKYVIVYKVSFK
eukprot:TRINITY_DN11015_c0_g1_i1.p1 TRINITY_DN11015_c0_g1~~TRINITY_DN11015_c0_g1_i1.p1  ORF type:complete len:493 (-),score=112.33 TRINITY_DN11015_c0_g1_i1:8-1486(-)